MNATHPQTVLRIGSPEHLTRELHEAREAIRESIARMEREYHRRKGHGTHIEASQPREYPLPDQEDLCELIREHPAFKTTNPQPKDTRP